MTREQLAETVCGFRNGILSGRSPEGMCAVVCRPLQGYLTFCGLATSLIRAEFEDGNHVWLEMEDGTVIDPTASQFNDEMSVDLPEVYIGQPTALHKAWMELMEAAL